MLTTSGKQSSNYINSTYQGLFIWKSEKRHGQSFSRKCWTEKKTTDLRLADFEIKEGDVLVLEEYNPETKSYTGRVLKKRVKNLNKVKLTDFHAPEDISKHGHWIIELE